MTPAYSADHLAELDARDEQRERDHTLWLARPKPAPAVVNLIARAALHKWNAEDVRQFLTSLACLVKEQGGVEHLVALLDCASDEADSLVQQLVLEGLL
jgi:hypothetical protein